jgi:hypothetical protein
MPIRQQAINQLHNTESQVERKMTLILPARFSWVTRRYIESTRFREETGLSPEDYLERRRKASTTKQLAKDLSEGLGQPERKTEELKKLRAARLCGLHSLRLSSELRKPRSSRAGLDPFLC